MGRASTLKRLSIVKLESDDVDYAEKLRLLEMSRSIDKRTPHKQIEGVKDGKV